MSLLLEQKDAASHPFDRTTALEVRAALIEGREIALLDIREEAIFAEGHPLFAANLAFSRLELEAHARLPRITVPIVVYGENEDQAAIAARRLGALGYTSLTLLENGLQGWRDAGFELFQDVNSPSKAFGELVEARRLTPSISAQQLDTLIRDKSDIVVVDARRFDEFQTMSIPTARSAPGAELVYRLQHVALKPSTRVVVNCAGRTRSIIGTQSLINSGFPNPVSALRNGTIGWKLANLKLDHGASESMPAPRETNRQRAALAARKVADAAGVLRTSLLEAQAWRADNHRTTYYFDVRTPEEFAKGTLVHFRSAPGGQLVQETDAYVPVRGARIVLADDDGARANMTASWLAQMNCEVYVVDDVSRGEFSHRPSPQAFDVPTVDNDALITPTVLHALLQSAWLRKLAVLDFSTSAEYRMAHISCARFALRSRINEALRSTEDADRYVVTAGDDVIARFAWHDLADQTKKPVYLLAGGNSAWKLAGYDIDDSSPSFASLPVDRYRRPYEGTDSPESAMQAYLDWEYGLVEQLGRDGTHGFKVLEDI